MNAVFQSLEKKYGIRIVSDGNIYNPYTGKSIERYKIFSADGCRWENGLSYKGVIAECKQWSQELLQIKENWSESTLPFC